MKTSLPLVVLGLLLVLVTSCSHLNFGGPTSKTEVKTPVGAKRVVAPVAPTAVWYLATHDKVTLYLKNLDNGMPMTVILERGLNQFPIPVGHWELSGFEEGGNSFTSMNTSKKFVFRARPRAHTYAGSIVIGCPKVGPGDFKYLKSMRFFNRYPFSSSSRLCEIIVGNDYKAVKLDYQKRPESRGLPLTLGF